MIASLVMYKHAQLVPAYDRYWALIRAQLITAGVACPERLSQDVEEGSVWLRPGLVLSQTCGMPYRTRLKDHVTLIGTPDYGVPDCPPGYYHSVIVVRTDDPRDTLPDFRDAIFAYNETFSQSGYAAPYFHVVEQGFWFENLFHSGAHIRSAKAVAEGRADIASLDAVTWRLIQRYEDFADRLRVLDVTKPTPGLPYISAKGVDQPAIFEAVRTAMSALDEADRNDLGLKDLIYIPPTAYTAVPNP